MREIRKQGGITALRYTAILCTLIAAYGCPLFAGSITPSQAPAPTMYTLNDIYHRISSGTEAGTHTLSPSAAPSATTVTLDDIYNALPGGTTTSATTDDVGSGKTFITRVDGVLTFMVGTRTGGHELPASGQVTSYANYDDAYNESQSVGFSSATRTMNYTMYNYVDGSLVETSDVTRASVTVDNLTGLMWTTDGNLMEGTTTWADALTWCQNLDYAGFTDWRLPNCRELLSIVNYGSYGPAIDTTRFRNTQNYYYWTSTTPTDASIDGNAWYVYFQNGMQDFKDKSSSACLRAVRGGP